MIAADKPVSLFYKSPFTVRLAWDERETLRPIESFRYIAFKAFDTKN